MSINETPNKGYYLSLEFTIYGIKNQLNSFSNRFNIKVIKNIPSSEDKNFENVLNSELSVNKYNRDFIGLLTIEKYNNQKPYLVYDDDFERDVIYRTIYDNKKFN